MLLLQMASTSLFVVSLLAVNSPQLVDARLAGQDESFLAPGKCHDQSLAYGLRVVLKKCVL